MTVHKVISFIFAILFLATLSAQAQKVSELRTSPSFMTTQQSSTAYSPSFGRLSMQFGSGALIGAGGGILGGLASMAIFVPNRDNSASGFANLGAFVLGGTISYTISSALGVYIVGNSHEFDASFGSIWLGSTLGSAAGIGSFMLIGKDAAALGIAMGLALPIIGGMIANNMSIDKRSTHSTALLDVSGPQTSLAAPSVQLTRISNHNIPAISSYTPTVKLLNISL